MSIISRQAGAIAGLERLSPPADFPGGPLARARKKLVPLERCCAALTGAGSTTATWCSDAGIVAHQDLRSPEGFHSLESDAHAWQYRRGIDLSSRKAIGGNIEVVGTPEQFVQLHRAGTDGLQLSFFDFRRDLECFGDRILPLFRQACLRL